LLHQAGDLFKLNVKLRCQKVNVTVTRKKDNRRYKKLGKQVTMLNLRKREAIPD
jgi:hypothetical protein